MYEPGKPDVIEAMGEALLATLKAVRSVRQIPILQESLRVEHSPQMEELYNRQKWELLWANITLLCMQQLLEGQYEGKQQANLFIYLDKEQGIITYRNGSDQEGIRKPLPSEEFTKEDVEDLYKMFKKSPSEKPNLVGMTISEFSADKLMKVQIIFPM